MTTSLHFANRAENVEAKAETHGRSTVLVLEDVDGTRLQVSVDRDLAETIHRLLGEQLVAQDESARDLTAEQAS